MSRLIATLLAAVLGIVGVVAVVAALASQDPAPPEAPVAAASTSSSSEPTSPTDDPTSRPAPTDDPTSRPAQQGPKGPAGLPESTPVRIRIDGIDVTAGFVDLGVETDGTLEVPTDPAAVGWYTGGHTPGAPGVAVLAGHVTWDQEPSVFFRLGQLRPRDQITVSRADGSTAIFEVQRVASFPKSSFPTKAVYSHVERPVLRLITCGGTYDEANSRYLDNTIVWAKLVGTRSA